MEPVIGIVSCGFMNQRQFVPQTYIQTVEDAGGIPVVLPCTHDIPATEGCATASYSAAAMT